MIFCVKRLRDFLCQKGFLLQKKVNDENIFLGDKRFLVTTVNTVTTVTTVPTVTITT